MLPIRVLFFFVWLATLVLCKKPSIELGPPIEVPDSVFSIRPFADYYVKQLDDLLVIRKLGLEISPSFLVGVRQYDGRVTYEHWETTILNCNGTSEISEINTFSWYICHENSQNEGELSFTRATLILERQALLISVAKPREHEKETIMMLNALLSSVSLIED